MIDSLCQEPIRTKSGANQSRVYSEDQSWSTWTASRIRGCSSGLTVRPGGLPERPGPTAALRLRGLRQTLGSFSVNVKQLM